MVMVEMEKQEICPVCGANRTALKWMLAEPPVLVETGINQKVAMESEKYILARARILKCPACREVLAGELRVCPRCRGQILGEGNDESCLQCGYIPRNELLAYDEKWKHKSYLR